jgi:glycosyltransferase involved in cell wall biosynthesis
MNAPVFSIIIPTRNRYDTLKFSIQTVLQQQFSSFELIVSDNSDSENLQYLDTIREYLSDERIKYYRPETVLSMSDHWEFAVSKAIGDYLIIFGDDDGLVSGALATIKNALEKTNVDIVSWARVEYSWPDRLPLQFSNQMVIPYRGKTGIVNGEQYIKKVIATKGDYRYLPMFYNSAVSSKAVQLLKQKSGRVFNASSPDIYTGFAFAHLIKNYITIGNPLSINGVSARSNGAAHASGDKSIKSDHWTLMKKSSIKWPESLPQIYTSYMGIIEPFVQLSHAFPEIGKYITRKQIFKNIIDTLESIDEDDLQMKLEKILENAKNDSGLYNWVSYYIQKVKPIVNTGIRDYKDRIGFDGSHLVVDASKFGLQNIYDVSIFVNNLCGNLKDDDYHQPVFLPLFKRIKRAAGIILNGA